MHINLSSEMVGFIKSKVVDGFYGKATEVIRDAIRRMQAEEIRAAAWQSSIRLGDEQADRGDVVTYSAQTLDDITTSAINAVHNGQPIDPDVLP